jgi:hypothetical protein
VLVAACNDAAQPDRVAPPPPPPSAAALPSAAPPPPVADAAAPDVLSDGGTAAGSDLAGTWEGRYDAKKGTIELPPKVKDKTHDGDDGKSSIGQGTVRITISAEGDVRGKAGGALGNATLSGKAEGGMVRISVFPDDPLGNGAMTGVLIVAAKDGVLTGELRVAGPDAKVIRESLVELKRK